MSIIALLVARVPAAAAINPDINDYSHAPAIDLQSLLDKAVEDHSTVVTLPPGASRVASTGIHVRNAKGLSIKGAPAGSTLVFTQYDQPGLLFEDCQGVTLSDFAIDYDPLPHTQGMIVGKTPDGSVLDVDILDGYRDITPRLDDSARIHFFDGKTLEWKRSLPEGWRKTVEIISPRKARVTMPGNLVASGQTKSLSTGDLIVFSMRRQSALLFSRTSDIHVENVRIYASPGAATVVSCAAGENVFNGYRVLRGPAPQGAAVPRLLSTNADGLYYESSRKGPLIENCELSYMGDDGINLHGPAFMIVGVEAPNIVWCLRRTAADNISRFYDTVLLPGDPVRILASDNFAIKRQVTLAKLETDLTPPFTLTRQEILRANSFANLPKEKYLRLTLSNDAKADIGDVIDFPAANSPGFVIRNNYIHDVRPRGMRIMADSGLIENNHIARTMQPAINLGAHYAFYREAGWLRDVTVRGNLIQDIGLDVPIRHTPAPAAISVWAELASDAPAGSRFASDHRNIQIVGNTIQSCSVEAINVNGVRGGLIADNQITDCNTTAPTDPLDHGEIPRGHAIVVAYSADVTVENNTFHGNVGDAKDPVFIAPFPAGPAPTDIYLLVGQSNMAGRGHPADEDRRADPRVLVLSKNNAWIAQGEPIHFDKPGMDGVGPGFAFGKLAAEADHEATIGLVPCAFGGSPISRWVPGGDLYQSALDRVRIALKGGGRLKAILWHQGEAECGSPVSAGVYAKNLTRVVEGFRRDLNMPEVPFIAGELGRFLYTRTKQDLDYSRFAPVVNAQIDSLTDTLPYFAIASSEGLTDRGDELHFSTTSQHELARRYFDALQTLERKK